MILLLLALLVKSTYVRYPDFFTNLLYLHQKSAFHQNGTHFFHYFMLLQF